MLLYTGITSVTYNWSIADYRYASIYIGRHESTFSRFLITMTTYISKAYTIRVIVVLSVLELSKKNKYDKGISLFIYND